MNYINQVICGKCEEVVKKFDNEIIDLVVTSPPYNVDLGKNKYKKNGYDVYYDDKDYKAYIKWLKEIFQVIKPKLKVDGRIAINVGNHNNGAVPVFSDIIQFMTKELHYGMFSFIVWNKNTTSNRAAFGSYLSPSCPSFPTPFEFILIFYNIEKKKKGLKENIDIKKEDFIKNSYALWNIAPEKRQKELNHPSPFPVELPRRLIQQLTYKHDLILDPFCGVGTTLVAAKELERDYIGIDISKQYCETAKERINEKN